MALEEFRFPWDRGHGGWGDVREGSWELGGAEWVGISPTEKKLGRRMDG